MIPDKVEKVELKILSEQVEAVKKQVKSMADNLDLHIADTDKEIGDIQELRMIVAANTEAINELRKALERHIDRVSNRVVQAIEPMLESTQDLKESIDKKRFVRFNNEIKGFWKRMWDKIRIKR